MKQYEVRWTEMPPPVGRRPVLLLSRTPAARYLNKLIVAEVTTTIRDIPQEVLLGLEEGLPQPCVANFDNLHVVAKTRLGERLGSIPEVRIPEIKRALGYALDWPELKILG